MVNYMSGLYGSVFKYNNTLTDNRPIRTSTINGMIFLVSLPIDINQNGVIWNILRDAILHPVYFQLPYFNAHAANR